MAGVFKRELYTEIEIGAPAELVWEILTDIDAFPDWNPFLRRATGTLAAGKRLEVQFASGRSKPVVFRPALITVERPREMRWLGHLLLPWLFDGEHIFEIRPFGSDAVHFIQREIFTGLLVPLFWKELHTHTRQGFHRMNEALKRRVEEEMHRT